MATKKKETKTPESASPPRTKMTEQIMRLLARNPEGLNGDQLGKLLGKTPNNIYIETEHMAAWARIQAVLPESSEDSRSSLADDVVSHICNLKTKNEQFRKDLCNTTTMLMKANSEIHDKDATIYLLKEKLESVEPHTTAERIAQLEQENYDAKQIIPNLERKVTALQKDLDRSRKDLRPKSVFDMRSQIKLTEERDEAIKEVERLRLVEAFRMLKKILSQA